MFLIREVRKKLRQGEFSLVHVPLSASCVMPSNSSPECLTNDHPAFIITIQPQDLHQQFKFHKLQDDYEGSKPCRLVVLISSLNSLE
jgi:hypothetical protein